MQATRRDVLTGATALVVAPTTAFTAISSTQAAPNLPLLRKYKAFLFYERRYLEGQLKRLDHIGNDRVYECHGDLNGLGMDAASRAETVLRVLGVDPHLIDY